MINLICCENVNFKINLTSTTTPKSIAQCKDTLKLESQTMQTNENNFDCRLIQPIDTENKNEDDVMLLHYTLLQYIYTTILCGVLRLKL